MQIPKWVSAFLVPLTGLEPVQCRHRGILSYVRPSESAVFGNHLPPRKNQVLKLIISNNDRISTQIVGFLQLFKIVKIKFEWPLFCELPPKIDLLGGN